MHIEDIEYDHEGTRMVGQLAVDESRPGIRPAVLVAHDAMGLSDHPKETARRLAELGYVALAIDYHGGGAPLPAEEVGPRLGALMGDPGKTRAVARAGLDTLLASEFADPTRVAAIGYCFGGTLSLELARSGADLVAVVSHRGTFSSGHYVAYASTRHSEHTNLYLQRVDGFMHAVGGGERPEIIALFPALAAMFHPAIRSWD